MSILTQLLKRETTFSQAAEKAAGWASALVSGLSTPLIARSQPAAIAGMVKAQTQAEGDARSATLTCIRDLAAWERAGWNRTADAQAWCARR